MRTMPRVLGLALLVAGGCDQSNSLICPDGVKSVSVDEELASLDGDTPSERFDRAAGPWDCSITWLALPAGHATQVPEPSSSVLDLTLERTSDEARYREYPLTQAERYEATRCQTDAVFVPCSLGLASEDGALDETIDCELRLQGENTYVHLVVPGYEFEGDHALTFDGDVRHDAVEFSIVYTPGAAPARIDGSIVESGIREGRSVHPLLTSALIACVPL